MAGGGRLLAMKGRYPTDELAKGFSGWKVVAVHRLHVPGLDEGGTSSNCVDRTIRRRAITTLGARRASNSRSTGRTRCRSCATAGPGSQDSAACYPLDLRSPPSRTCCRRATGRAVDSPADWRSDLVFARTEMPRRHVNLFHTLSPAAYDTAFQRLLADLDHLTEHEIIVRLAEIVASVGDGHSRLT